LGRSRVLPARCSAGPLRCSAGTIVTLHAEHPAGARIGIEHEHPAIGGEPFQAVVRFAVGAAKRPLDIGERARPFAADSTEDLIERADFARLHTFAGTIGLCRCRFQNRGSAKQKQTYQRREVPHGPPFTAESLNST
jgi:hypothetical protein